MLLLIVALAIFAGVFQTTRSEVGSVFPGYLTFANGVVGAFYLPSWPGHQAGLSYHDRIQDQKWAKPFQWQEFTSKDFALVVLVPAVSGLLFILIGFAATLSLPTPSGKFPLLFFHFLVGIYLIFSPEVQITYYSTYFHFTVFSLLPAVMIHFALLFPEKVFEGRATYFYLVPYVVSLGLLIPYLRQFWADPVMWITAEAAVVAYLIAAYLFWIVRLALSLRKLHSERTRILARALLTGQVIAFFVPLAAAVAVFVGKLSVPLNLVAPVVLLFPIAFSMGIFWARLRESQSRLLQAEKRAALGQMLAGLAHEINNPMTFIYSNIEPLRESIGTIKEKIEYPDVKTVERLADLDSLVNDIEEGANRAKGIIDSFREFSHPNSNQRKDVDLHSLIDKSLNLLSPKWKDRVEIVRRYGGIPKYNCSEVEMGQVFVNLLTNAIDALPQGGTVSVFTDLIPPASARSEPPKIEVKIRDTGMGISKDKLARIFDPFYTTKAPGEGTGLGLATALEMVHKHQGKLEVKSEPAKGTEFTLQLPVPA